MQRLQRTSLLLGTATLLTACTRQESFRADSPIWTVGKAALVTIADSAAPRGHEFNGILSARRLPDHSILLANAGASELALFDSAGRFLRTMGRKGQGPGEYQGAIAVFRWRADSLAVYDAANFRWTILDSRLGAIRTTSPQDPEFLRPTWLYQGAIVSDGVLEPLPVWVLRALSSVRRSDPEYRHLIHGRRDDLGALWIRDSLDEKKWLVYIGADTAVATVVLPSGLEPLQIGADFVLGVVRDSLGVEALRIYALHRPAAATVPSGPPAPPLLQDPSVMAALPNLMMAQEMYYAGHGRYAGNADSLALRSPFPSKLFLLEGDARHWTAIGVRQESGVTCGVSVGWPAPLGWLDGGTFCGR